MPGTGDISRETLYYTVSMDTTRCKKMSPTVSQKQAQDYIPVKKEMPITIGFFRLTVLKIVNYYNNGGPFACFCHQVTDNKKS